MWNRVVGKEMGIFGKLTGAYKRRQALSRDNFSSCDSKVGAYDAEKLPKITVITPSYNQVEFLEECISSVLDQKYPKLEYIIIDGGSTDGSIEIIKKYEDKVSFWVSEPDAGQSDAINKGLKKCTGKLVSWLNADDFYFPGALSAVAETYLQNPNASFYFGNGWRVDKKGKIKGRFFPTDQLVFNREALILGLNYILQPATFINSTDLLKVGYLNPSLKFGMDTDLWIRLSEIRPPQPIPEFIAATREYGLTKTATGGFERVEELRRIAEKYSGLSMTPGVLCYFLDTLNNMLPRLERVFPSSFRRQIEAFWAEVANLMEDFGARPDGFPYSSTARRRGKKKDSLKKILG